MSVHSTWPNGGKTDFCLRARNYAEQWFFVIIQLSLQKPVSWYHVCLQCLGNLGAYKSSCWDTGSLCGSRSLGLGAWARDPRQELSQEGNGASRFWGKRSGSLVGTISS